MQPVTAIDTVFYYLIDLHYSQTMINKDMQDGTFYYLIDLHYSQTMIVALKDWESFTTL